MQIVIDIDEEDYNYIKDVNETNSAVTSRLYEAVCKGKPLDNIKTKLKER